MVLRDHLCLHIPLRKKKQNWVIIHGCFLLLLFLYSHLNFWIVTVIRSGQAVSFLHETIWCLSCLFHLVGQWLSISTRTAVQGTARGSWTSAGDGFQVLTYRKITESQCRCQSSRHSAAKAFAGKVMVLVLVGEAKEKLWKYCPHCPRGRADKSFLLHCRKTLHIYKMSTAPWDKKRV